MSVNNSVMTFNANNYYNGKKLKVNNGNVYFRNIPYAVHYDINVNNKMIVVENCPKCSFYINVHNGKIVSDNDNFDYKVNNGSFQYYGTQNSKESSTACDDEEVKVSTKPFLNSIASTKNTVFGDSTTMTNFGNFNSDISINSTGSTFIMGNISIKLNRIGNDLKFEIPDIDEIYVNGKHYNIGEEGQVYTNINKNDSSIISIRDCSLIVQDGCLEINTHLRVFVNNTLLS